MALPHQKPAAGVSESIDVAMNPLQCSLERLRRADLPVRTMELAQYLIGKTLVHKLPTARLSGVIVETGAFARLLVSFDGPPQSYVRRELIIPLQRKKR